MVSEPPQSKQIITIKESSSESITTKIRSDMWVTCNGYRLYNKNKQQLLNGRELTDMHIDGALALLKQQYPEIGGLQSTLYQQSDKPLLQPKLFRSYTFFPNIGQPYQQLDVKKTLLNCMILCSTLSLYLQKTQLSNC